MAAEEASIYHPLAGRFSWRWSGLPSSLTSQWAPGQDTPVTKGALMTFQAAQNTYNDAVEYQTLSQMADASVWQQLLTAALKDQRNPYPYSYVYVTKQLPETLQLWENGKLALTSAANTGIPQDPTADGTYPIYLRYKFQIMRGTNPDGSTYADPVYWINYFNGSDAVHGFLRASYGFPQSLGCVELPIATAKEVFPDLMIGDLVTVAG
jgi:lipoprotein-anchoring transpeptidase ErfK/SrfK